ncbi:Wall-associated receptor kinase 2 [Bienertia sinuspersici]
MYKVVEVLFCVFLSWLILTSMNILGMTQVAKPDCPSRCGNVTIPYPFGIGLDGPCSLSNPYSIYCNSSFDPPKPFLLGTPNLEILQISITGQMRVRNIVATRCYRGGDMVESSNLMPSISLRKSLPLVFSDTANVFTVVGCDDFAVIEGTVGRNFKSGCLAVCSSPAQVPNDGSCSSIGCCRTDIPKGGNMILTSVTSMNNHSDVYEFNPCSHAFLAEVGKFEFDVADLSDSNFVDKVMDDVPIVLEWFVGANQSCGQAMGDLDSYACQQNTNCTDFDDQGHELWIFILANDIVLDIFYNEKEKAH